MSFVFRVSCCVCGVCVTILGPLGFTLQTLSITTTTAAVAAAAHHTYKPNQTTPNQTDGGHPAPAGARGGQGDRHAAAPGALPDARARPNIRLQAQPGAAGVAVRLGVAATATGGALTVGLLCEEGGGEKEGSEVGSCLYCYVCLYSRACVVCVCVFGARRARPNVDNPNQQRAK
jgi:hypothetical protein